jgi:hypothetical protein
MAFKKHWKLTAPVLAMMLAAACSDGQDMQEDIQDEPVNGDINTEEPLGGETDSEVPANDDMNMEEPTGEEADSEVPDSEEFVPEEPTGEETNPEDPTNE